MYQDVRKVMSPVEWLPGQYQKCFWKLEKEQWLCWCHSGLWGWSAGCNTQGDLGWFQSFLSEAAWKKQTPIPSHQLSSMNNKHQNYIKHFSSDGRVNALLHKPVFWDCLWSNIENFGPKRPITGLCKLDYCKLDCVNQ